MKKEPRITLPIKKPAKVDKQGPQWRFIIIYLLVTLFLLWAWQELFRQATLRTIPYSQFKHYLALHEVTEAVVKESEIDGKIVPKAQAAENAPSAEASASASPGPSVSPSPEVKKEETAPFFFRTERVEDPDLVKQLQAGGVEYGAERPGFLSQLLGSWILPIAFMFILWSLLARRMGGAGQSIFGIGRSGARLVADSDTKVTFDDVAGCDEAKFELKEVVDFLKSPTQYEDLGARIPKGVLLVGPPGAGKTMLARRMPTILPALTEDEALEVIAIHSVAGVLTHASVSEGTRPFRAPHHSISSAGLIGGGSLPRPGEVSLAHHGVLFLDEMLEFPRHVLEGLRQPMEDAKVVIARAAQAVTYPARFTLIGASNPCPCGKASDPSGACNCSAAEIERYNARISGPLADRIDMHVTVGAVALRDLSSKGNGDASASIRARVERARATQRKRYAKKQGISCNAYAIGRWLGRLRRPEP